jgi:large subunit ribosomal protein L14
MVQKLSRLKVADNTGIKEIMIIQVLGRVKGNMFSKFGYVGDIVSASVKKVMPNTEYKKGDVIHAVVVRTTKEYKRKDGTHIKFDENSAAIINKANKEPKGTRIFGPVARELREMGFNKVVSMAPEVL